MASNRKNGQPSNPDEQILVLRDWMKTAHANSYPQPTDEEKTSCPNLIAFLAPEVIGDPDHRGEHKPKKVVREPMLMVTWDTAAGRWKWVITDKVCRVQVGGWFDTLTGFSAQIEAQLSEKKCWVKELERTRRKEE